MLTCPLCKKNVEVLVQQCPRCGTDLSLLIEFLENCQVGLAQAESWTRQGELGQAIWAYLQVLDFDPDNPTASGQIGQVVSVVRQFDQRKQLFSRLDCRNRQTRFRAWLTSQGSRTRLANWLIITGCILVFILCLTIAFHLGGKAGDLRRSEDTHIRKVF